MKKKMLLVLGFCLPLLAFMAFAAPGISTDISSGDPVFVATPGQSQTFGMTAPDGCTASITINNPGYWKMQIGGEWYYKFSYTVLITGHTDYQVTGQWYHVVYNIIGGESAHSVTRIRGPGAYPDSTNWYHASRIAKVIVWLKLDCSCGTSFYWTPFTYYNPG